MLTQFKPQTRSHQICMCRVTSCGSHLSAILASRWFSSQMLMAAMAARMNATVACMLSSAHIAAARCRTLFVLQERMHCQTALLLSAGSARPLCKGRSPLLPLAVQICQDLMLCDLNSPGGCMQVIVYRSMLATITADLQSDESARTVLHSEDHEWKYNRIMADI